MHRSGRHGVALALQWQTVRELWLVGQVVCVQSFLALYRGVTVNSFEMRWQRLSATVGRRQTFDR